MRKVGFLFCVLCLIALRGDLAAEERQGADAVIAKKDGQAVKGELVAVKEDSLLLLGQSSKTEISVSISEINSIKVKTRTGGSHVLIIGSAMALGGIAGGVAAHSVPFNDHPGKGGAIGVAAGLGAGLIIDFLIKSSETYKIEGLSPEALKTVLGKLRLKARVPDSR
jgi:hypothetical protein